MSALDENGLVECPHKELGCNGKIQAFQIYTHADRCSYGNYFCPYRNHLECDWKGILENLQKHLRFIHNEHNAYAITPFPVALQVKNYMEKTNVLQVISSRRNTFFWVGRNEGSGDRKSYFSLQYVGPYTWADRFRYSVTLRTDDGLQALSEYHNATSYRYDPYNNMSTQRSAVFYNDYLELCLDKTGTLFLEIDVRFIGPRY